MIKTFNITLLCLASLLLVLLAIIIGIIFDLQACKLCLYARWPHFFTFLMLPFFLLFDSQIYKVFLIVLGCLAMLGSVLISGYHSGIERNLWNGPSSCSITSIGSDISVEQLLDEILSTSVIRCDEMNWDFLYLSMANWNTLISIAFLCLWLNFLSKMLFLKSI